MFIKTIVIIWGDDDEKQETMPLIFNVDHIQTIDPTSNRIFFAQESAIEIVDSEEMERIINLMHTYRTVR